MKTLRGRLTLVGVLVLVVSVGWITVRHYQLKGALAAYREHLRAQGEKLTIAELTPGPSGAPNGASLLWSASDRLGSLRRVPPMMSALEPGRALVVWAQANVSVGGATNFWLQLNSEIEPRQTLLAELRLALHNPVLQFDLDYGQPEILLRHFGPVRTAVGWLTSATILDLHESHWTNAWENLRAATSIVELYGGEPLPVSQNYRLDLLFLVVNATWEALQAPGWSDAELAELQGAWEAMDLLGPVEASFAMQRERIAQLYERSRDSIDVFRSMTEIFGENDPLSSNWREVLHRSPVGFWFWGWLGSYEEEFAHLQIWQVALQATRMVRTNQSFAAALSHRDAEIDHIRQGHPSMSDWLGGALPRDASSSLSTLHQLAVVEIQRHVLVTAIALKRHQLLRGRLPADLQELVPQFVSKAPLDPMDGKPLRYRLNRDGSFLLYSVGDDGLDNGGDPSPARPGTGPGSKFWSNGRDVVWPMPATQEEVNRSETSVLAKPGSSRSSGAGSVSTNGPEALSQRLGFAPTKSTGTNQLR